MIQLLKYRIQLITILFTAFGGAMVKIFSIYELTLNYLGFSCLIALIVSLLTSFLIKGKKTKAMENKLKIASLLLFVLFIGSFALHVVSYEGRTFKYETFNNELMSLVKGDRYSHLGDSLANLNVPPMTPGEILKEKLGGPPENPTIWEPESFSRNKLILVGTFCLVVIFISALASLLLENVALGKASASPSKPLAAGTPAAQTNITIINSKNVTTGDIKTQTKK